MRSGSFESFQSVKNLERLSKNRSNNRATDRSGTVDFAPLRELLRPCGNTPCLI
jgi:hypothetical protein